MTQEIIIDAKDAILGRLSTFVAKQALQGKTIKIINSEKAVIIGSRKDILQKYKHKDQRGDPHHGPYLQKTPHRLVKRTIRGMLPYKIQKGALALKRIKCFKGNEKDEKAKIIKSAQLDKSKILKYITIGELCKELKK